MKKPAYLFYRAARPMLSWMFLLAFRPEIQNTHNIPRQGGVVLAGNHKNSLDPCLIALSTKRVVRFLAKKELHQGAFRFFFKGMATVPVDRGKKDATVMETTVGALKSGEIVSLFPEGTRNRTREMLLPFKFGAVSMAQRSGCYVVPFAITGQYRLFRKGLRICFGEPLDVTNVEITEANQMLQEEVKKLMKKDGGAYDLS